MYLVYKSIQIQYHDEMLKDIFINEMINTILTFGELAESKLAE